ncbi:MAG: hypothetical protein GY943_19530, partial [Chloroflexi bacterium]|nr:hypothetical protein [Chloroflexota bacterium]
MAKQQQIIKQIKMAGIIASLPGDMPLQSILQVADALLAAPVLGVEVSMQDEQGVQIIADLAKRADGKMVIGAEGVETAVQAQSALDAGAEYISSSRLDFDLMA